MKRTSTLLVITFAFFALTRAQNVGINATGAAPNNSAMLDVTSLDKGLLIPRVTLVNVTNGTLPVASPATGLLVFNTNAAVVGGNGIGFYFWNGTQWIKIANTTDITQDWRLSGNAGTVDNVNFIGTTDNVPLNFRVNNQRAGRIDSTNANVFFGFQSGNALTTGTNNSFFGHQAGSSNNIGRENTAIGVRALSSNTSSSRNTVIGYEAMRQYNFSNSNTVFNADNVIIGYQAALNLNATASTNGRFNVIIGSQAGFGSGANPSGVGNVFVGRQAGESISTGQLNTFLGDRAGRAVTTGSNNVAQGSQALRDITTGLSNTAIGNNTGFNLTTGSNNTLVGNGATVDGVNLANRTFAAAFGASAVVTADNTIRIGDNAISRIEGQVNWSASSDGRFKTNVAALNTGLDFILKLKPVSYNFDLLSMARFVGQDVSETGSSERLLNNSQIRRYGFIAQEVEAAAVEVGEEFDFINKPVDDGDTYGIAYGGMVVPLVKAVQEQQAIIQSQEDEISQLKVEIEEMKALLQQIMDKLD